MAAPTPLQGGGDWPPPDRLVLRLLGPLEIVAGGRALPVVQPRLRGLLTLLALRPNRVAAVDWLVEELWEGQAREKAVHALQMAISRLRRALEPTGHGAGGILLRTRPPGYVLEADPDHIDVFRFERLAEEGRSALEAHAAHRAASLLREALGLWRGPALTDALGSTFVQSERGRLEELRIGALEDRIDADLALRRHLDLLGELGSLVAVHPFRERLWYQLMTALQGAGRQSEALEAYRRARTILREELGVDPGSALQDLHRRILRRDPSLEEAVLRGSAGSPGNLPAAVTSFVGRERERVQVHELLQRYRLVTLTGAGGIGKTRLALETARDESFPDGVWYADLAALSDGGLAPAAILSALGVAEQAGQPAVDRLTAYLGPRRLLLVLDNCEHLRQACAALVEALLEECPRLSILATSRELLGVPAEAVYRVAPLRVAADSEGVGGCLDSEAVRLFADRADLGTASVQSPDKALTVARICRRLDGLPLALELVASWVGTLSVEEIDSVLSDRFWLLTEGSPERPPRARSLHAALGWSYRLLGDEERRLLRRLAVFRGPFTLEAAEYVGGADVLRLIRALVAKSWLVTEPDPRGSTWYRLLEPVREYAADVTASGELETARSRHAAYFASLAERSEPDMRGPRQVEQADRLERMHDNFRAALGWSVERDPETGLRIAAALWWFWMRKNHFEEGRSWLDRLLDETNGPSADRGRALVGAALLAVRWADYEAIERLAAEAVEVTRELGDASGQARALGLLWLARSELGGGGGPKKMLDESLRLAREADDAWGVSVTLEWQAVAARRQGNLETARTALEEALAIQKQMENPRGVVYMTVLLAGVLSEQGDLAEAARLGGEASSIARSLNDDGAVADAFLQLAAIEARRGAMVAAVRLLAAADASRERGGIRFLPWDRATHDDVTSQARLLLGADAFARAWDEGRAMGTEDEDVPGGATRAAALLPSA